MEAIARIPYKRFQQFTPADSVTTAAELFVAIPSVSLVTN
jgi:hypothetical protein